MDGGLEFCQTAADGVLVAEELHFILKNNLFGALPPLRGFYFDVESAGGQRFPVELGHAEEQVSHALFGSFGFGFPGGGFAAVASVGDGKEELV